MISEQVRAGSKAAPSLRSSCPAAPPAPKDFARTCRSSPIHFRAQQISADNFPARAPRRPDTADSFDLFAGTARGRGSLALCRAVARPPGRRAPRGHRPQNQIRPPAFHAFQPNRARSRKSWLRRERRSAASLRRNIPVSTATGSSTTGLSEFTASASC